jgi:hypothetical protein
MPRHANMEDESFNDNDFDLEMLGGARRPNAWVNFLRENKAEMSQQIKAGRQLRDVMQDLSARYRMTNPVRVVRRGPCASDDETRRNQANCSSTPGCTWVVPKKANKKTNKLGAAHCRTKPPARQPSL